jgi:hypothetical protein
LSKNLKGRDLFRDLGIDGRMYEVGNCIHLAAVMFSPLVTMALMKISDPMWTDVLGQSKRDIFSHFDCFMALFATELHWLFATVNTSRYQIEPNFTEQSS